MRRDLRELRNAASHSASGEARRRGKRRGRLLLERLERRDLLTIYSPIGVTLAPSPVEGVAFSGAVVGTFSSADPLNTLSATINWGPTASPTSSAGTITLIGSQFVPGVGAEPLYSVTGGTTYPEETNGAFSPITIAVADSTDSTVGIITSQTTVADAPLTTIGGLGSASITQGATVNFSGALALMTFTDGNPNSTPAEFRASVSWGDGTPATLGNLTKSGATYTVSGLHTYTRQTSSPYTLLVTVTDVGGSVATHSTSITITDAALSGASGIPFHAAEGQQLSNIPLGQFLDGNPFATAADYSVSINWGDGTSGDPGTATLVGGNSSNALFLVGGTHRYTGAAGSPYTVTATVTEVGGSSTTITTSATVTQTPLAVSVRSLGALANSDIPSQVVGTFFDSGVPDAVGSYSATLNWGDGTVDATSGGLLITAVSGQPGMFAINAPDHVYSRPGLYPLSIIVNDSEPTSGSGNGAALIVAPALLAFDNFGGPINGAVEGQPLPPSTLVAGFVSQDPNAVIAGFSASIDWGDGTPSTVGVITQPGGVGTNFSVSGGHTYAHQAPSGATITVRVTDSFNNSSVATTQVTSIADAPLTTGTPQPVSATVHVPFFSVPVATFVDTNPGASAADFTAIINWGDGSAVDANAQVVLVGGSGSGAIFAVYGSHTYQGTGGYSIGVLVNDRGGQSLSIIPNASNVTVASSTISVAVLSESARAGVAIPAGTVIGTFTDLPVAGPVGQYSGVINWGDGTSPDSALTITAIGGSSFRVATTAGHTYATPGSYALSLTILDSIASGIGGNLAVVSGSLAPPVVTAGSPVVAVEGSFSTGLVLATFTDSTPNLTAGSFTAVIDWGDGSPASVGIVGNGNSVGSFSIRGNHTYAIEGSYVVSVSLADSAGNHVATSTTATVADAPLSSPSGLALTSAEDQPLVNVPLGTFLDGNRGATSADFDASIDWGDGSAASPGLVTLVGGSASGARFLVAGSHVYIGAGTFSVTVTISDAGGSTSTITTEATVLAPQITAAQAFPIAAIEGHSTADNKVVATFSHGANLNPIGNFAATIDWGDGSPTVAGTIAAHGSGYSVLAPSHTFEGPGTFVLHVSISDTDSPSSIVMTAGLAIVADAPLTPIATPNVSGTERTLLSNVMVGSFTDANPTGKPGDFLATISWGDGTTSLGSISQPGGVGTAFLVQGSHSYADALANGSGTFPIGVVVKDNGGQALVLASTATVADVPINASVILNPGDDHGMSNSDGITNDNTPSFLGGAEPGSTIQLYAISSLGTTLVGQGVTGDDGRFAVSVVAPMADGVYSIGVIATDASGHTVAVAFVPEPLVIDTVGPKVVGLRFNRPKGQIFATLADDRSGLDQLALVDGANYQFGTSPPRNSTGKSPYFVTSLATTVAAQPTNQQTLTIAINKGHALPKGLFLLTIDSAGGGGSPAGNGLRDVAGNALDGEFYGSFGSGNGRPGGNFVGGLDTSQRSIFQPAPIGDGYASPHNLTSTSPNRHNPVVVNSHKHAVKSTHAAHPRVVAHSVTPQGVHASTKAAKNRPR